MLNRLRRHPFLTLMITLAGVAGTALAIFLYKFDLNDYRKELQGTLQQSLSRPVAIGSIHFTFSHGLSLDLGDMSVGIPGDANSLRADHLLLQLRLTPLLLRQEFSFSRIRIKGGEVTLTLPEKGEDTPEVAGKKTNPYINLLRRTRIDALEVSDSRITLLQGGRSYSLLNTALRVDNLSFQAPLSIKAAGELAAAQLRAPWTLTGTIEPADADSSWQATRCDLQAKVNGINLARMTDVFSASGGETSVRGTADLDIQLYGAPQSGLNFKLHAASHDFSLHLPALYSKPVAARDARVEGIWRDGTPGRIDDLRLRIDNLAAEGKIVLPTAAEPLTATLSTKATPLSSVAGLIPDKTLPRLTEILHDHDLRGSVAVSDATIGWSQSAGMTFKQAKLALRNGSLSLREVGRIEQLDSDAIWEKDTLTLSALKASLLGGVSEGSGRISLTGKKGTTFDLKINSSATAEALVLLLPQVWQERLAAQGPVTLSGKIGGTTTRLLLDLQSNFTESSVIFDRIPLKERGGRGEILLLGTASASGLELSHSLLTLPFAEARANGRLALDESGEYDLSCDIKRLQIEKLPPFLAVQKDLRGQGEVDLRLDLNGDSKGLKHLQGNGEYRKLSIHLWDAVADLHDGSGLMTLSRDGINFPAIAAKLGSSPLRANAELKWLPEFKLTLNLDLARTRAADLIFNSPQKTFDTLRGRLIITASNIVFDKITAHIVDETTATINGTLTYHPAKVVLDITASRADVAGIIALWQNGEKKGESKEQNPADRGDPLVVEIATHIAAGDLYGVAFQEAEGMISLHGHKLLIQPLRLKIGSGKATIAIATGPLTAENPVLRVSGETEKIDAAMVQKQLLGRQGSISGTLTGNFFLEGEIGNYLPTCSGNVNFRLNQGLLRGFTSISRALALFNVGKILTFNFPDVAKDGLLFDRIKGNLLFNKGVASTEDLAVSSAAFDMAFVGNADLSQDKLDFIIGVKPLQTVDKVLSSIPLAGWILTGEKKAFVVAQFHVTGRSQDPKVEAIPFSSLSDMAVGIFKRTFGLPGKIVSDVKELFQ